MLDLGLRIGDVADVQIGAVGRQAGAQRRGHARRQIAADGRRADDANLRPVLLDQRRQHLGIGQRLIMGQPRMIGQVDVVDALRDQSLGQRANAGARQHGARLHAQPVGQFAGLAAKLQRHVVQRAVFLFREYPDFALAIRFGHS